MNNAKKMILLALTFALAVSLCACGGQTQQETEAPAPAGYSVTVVDGLGNPFTSGVIVRYMRDGAQVTMQVINEQGTATKELEDGAYTVELEFTGDERYYYDKSDLTLTPDKKSVTVTLLNTVGGEAQKLTAGEVVSDAYQVSEGTTYVQLDPAQRNYFLYVPSQSGTYEFTLVDSEAAIGYYGAPHFVQELSAAEVVDNAFTLSIKNSMIGTEGGGTATFVIGVDGNGQSDAVLSIRRIGEPAYDISDEPWVVYKKTVELAPYTLTGNTAEFDITASTDTYQLVLGSDGFYHLNTEDGPLVLVRLGQDSKYLDCYKTITDHTGVVAYFYDADGNFLKKESYTECLMEYYEYMDPDMGVYPLTEDLKTIIRNSGEHAGWWDTTSGIYLFKDENGNHIPDVNPDISWLFMCCYVTD